MLEGVGLGVEQEETYLGMLIHPGQPLDDIAARHPDRPRAQTAAAVEALVELGLATQLAGNPPQYMAIAPDVAIEGLVRARVDDARRAAQAIPALMDRFWTAAHHADAIDFIEIVTSEAAILQRWAQLERALSRELRGFDMPPYFVDPLQPDALELERLADDITFRVIYAQEVVDTPARWPDLEAGIAAGEQARVMPDLPAKLTLFDDFAATLSVPMAGAISVIVVHRSPLLDALSALFEAYWERATPLSLDGLLTPRQHEDDQLVRLLAAGLGDDAIQRALHVSGSTVYRRVHALMSSVGARTRFQAGFQLGRVYRDRVAEAQPRPRDATRQRVPQDTSRAARRTTRSA